MGRISVSEPYTGRTYQDAEDKKDDIEGLPEHVYLANGKVGQMFGIKAAAVAGVEYSLMKGLLLGVEFQPLSYRYDVIQICPRGFDKYNCDHHNFKVFDTPI